MNQIEELEFEVGDWVLFYNLNVGTLSVVLMAGKIVSVEEEFYDIFTAFEESSGLMKIDVDAIADLVPERMAHYLEESLGELVPQAKRFQMRLVDESN